MARARRGPAAQLCAGSYSIFRDAQQAIDEYLDWQALDKGRSRTPCAYRADLASFSGGASRSR
jgi:hypothetical protein